MVTPWGVATPRTQSYQPTGQVSWKRELNYQTCLFLLGGLTLLVLGQALKFPVFILFGLALIPLALGFIALVGYFVCDRTAPEWITRTGLFIFLGGLYPLTIGTWNASMLAWQVARAFDGLPLHPDYPLGAGLLFEVTLQGVVAATALGLGLYLRSGRWGWKCAACSAVTLLTLPGTAILFFILCFFGFPLST